MYPITMGTTRPARCQPGARLRMELLTSMQGSQTSLLVSFVLSAEDQKSWRGGEREAVCSPLLGFEGRRDPVCTFAANFWVKWHQISPSSSRTTSTTPSSSSPSESEGQSNVKYNAWVVWRHVLGTRCLEYRSVSFAIP